MHLRGLDLNLMVVLNALLEERNITRAGRRIYLSQSATSGALARLREYFDDELLVQIGHKMMLTPLAESLRKPIGELLFQAQGIIDQKPHFDPETATRRFRIMMSDYMAAVLMTRATRKIMQLAPSIGVDILALDSPEEGIEHGEIDFLIMPEQFLLSAHPSKELFRETYVCIAWSGNFSIRDELTLDEYFLASHIGIRFGPQPADNLDEWIFQHTGRVRKIAVRIGDFTLIPQFLVGTQYIATVHYRLARIFAGYLPLRILKAPLEMPELTEKIQWHRFRERDPGIAWMRQLLRSTAREIVETSTGVHQPAMNALHLLEDLQPLEETA